MSAGAGPGGPPPARGRRLPFAALPVHVRAAVKARLGSPVRVCRNRPGGFSPGLAARVTTAAGERLFLKAVGPEPNADAPAIHRREGRIAAALPAGVPAPRHLWTLDEGLSGWVVLAFEDVGGRPPRMPWRPGELGRVLDAVSAAHAALTPSPAEAPDAGEVMDRDLAGWRRMARERPAGLDAWSRRHMERLCRLEAQGALAVRGTTLLHMDLWADNLLLTGDGVRIVD